MSQLGSLYIELGSPQGELGGCCETADWAADYIADFSSAQLALHELLASIAAGGIIGDAGFDVAVAVAKLALKNTDFSVNIAANLS